MKKIRETDVKDERGEIVISPGLKVRHKDSHFEYTVDGVVQDDSGKIQVVLRLPDEPRFDPPGKPNDVIISRSSRDSQVIYEVDPNAVYYEPDQLSLPDDDSSDVEMISVDEEEFESDYEVS